MRLSKMSELSSLESVLSVRILAGTSRKVLVHDSWCAVSAERAFENCAPAVLFYLALMYKNNLGMHQ